ncbi:MAG TPA: sigma-70 family RNA polymerase sigma factor [Drouetiella sp.]
MFQILVRRYQGRVFTVAFRVLSNAEEAEEVVQDTFLKVHQNIAVFRKNASFHSWVFKIAHNICMDILRNRNKRKGFRLLSFDPQSSMPEPGVDSVESYDVISQLADPGPTPADSMALREQEEIVSESLKKLTDTQRTVVVLYDIEGFSYEEIAEISGTSIGTVRSRLHYGRVKLKELLEPYFSQKMSAVSR